MSDKSNESRKSTLSAIWLRVVVLVVALATIGFVYLQFGEDLTLRTLAQRETQLRDFQKENPIVVYGIAFAIYVAVTGLSLPGAAGLSLLYAWYFGFLRALILVSFASTIGATLAFLLVRFLFRDAVQRRFGNRLKSFDESLKKEGPFFLFTLRLIPAVPFFVINAVMGLTPIRVRTFYWVSQLGMLPGTMVYVYAGSRVPSLQKLADEGIKAVFMPSQLAQILIAFILLGLFPLIARFAIKRFKNQNITTVNE